MPSVCAQIRAACPNARLIADANEAWTPELLPALMRGRRRGRGRADRAAAARRRRCRAGRARARCPYAPTNPLHTRADLAALAGRYDAVNIKLDKAGGLTEALALAAQARALGLRIMVGCMVATSLAMAPAVLLAQGADWVDLDGPLLLARDRDARAALRRRARAPARPGALGLSALTPSRALPGLRRIPD